MNATVPRSNMWFVIAAPETDIGGELLRSGCFGPPESVELRETHLSEVFLSGARAFKLKKPVRLSFVDYSTRERRRSMCRAEIRLNRRLAPEIYRGVRSVVAADGGYALANAARADGVEYLVEMRRFREEDTLASRLRAKAVRPWDLDQIAAFIAAFHANSRHEPGVDPSQQLRALFADHFETLSDEGALRRFAGAYLDRHDGLLRNRSRFVVDGHGDMRAEHVVLEDPIQIVDCVEFDPSLRALDAAHDFAFLAMDVESIAGTDTASRLVDAYHRYGGNTGAPHLLAFYSFERALVRAKVDAIRAAQGDAHAAARVAEKLTLARSLGWRARGSEVVVLCGLSGSGKTWLANGLASARGARVVSSDVVRKELAGVRLGDRAGAEAYTPEFSRRVYAEVGQRAQAMVSLGSPVVIDATCRRAVDRAALLSELRSRAGSALFVHCEAPPDVLRARVRARAAARRSVSDADEAVLARQHFEPLVEAAADRVCGLRTDRSLEAVMGDLEAWLDKRFQ